MSVARRSVRLLILILLSAAVVNAEAAQKARVPPASPPPYALTISGGISLGVYEAGLNWVIVEALRDSNSQDSSFRLDTVTGASAGAINTLLSVIRFCELHESGSDSDVMNNLFKDTWGNIDIVDLLPEKAEKYKPLTLELGGKGKRDLNDALFSRAPFEKVLADLSRRVVEGKDKNDKIVKFRDGITVKLALMVTRSQPLEASIKTSMGPQRINSQRFVIPLIAETRTITRNGESVVVLLFRNNTKYQPDNGQSMEHLFLPESDGYIGFDQVIRAALASSAFPFAFGRVNLEYCRPTTRTPSSDGKPSDTCPADTLHSSGYFSDGGTFDNVPLGVAVELIEQENKQRIDDKYIYMDPAYRRSIKQESKQVDSDEGSLVLGDQIKSLIPAFGTLMSGELYRTLIAKFDKGNLDNRHRNLLLTRRFPPLTGSFLVHFGAFFDPSFRTYDYAAGVYDGLMNTTDYLYLLEDPRAPDSNASPTDPLVVGARKAEIFRELVEKHLDFHDDAQENKQILQLIGAFLKWEKTSPVWNEVWSLFRNIEPKDKGPHAVFEALYWVGDSDFDNFLRQLEPQWKLFGPQVRFMLQNPEVWKLVLAKRAIDRLVTIEDKGEGDLMLLLKVASVIANSKRIKGDNTIWSLSSVSNKKWWYRIVPDGIAMDGAQTGVTLSYLAVPDWGIWKWAYLETDATAHIQLKEVAEEQTHFVSMGLALRHSRKKAGVSSFGVGLNVNRNISDSDEFGQDFLVGGEVNIGVLADRLRVSVGTRALTGGYKGELLSVRFGFTDLDAWVSLLGKK